MPWSIEEGHSSCPASRPFAVVKDADGSVEGCHPSAAAAKRQQAALYANEPEARAQLKAASINDLPDSAFAYIEPGGSKDDQGKTVPRSKRHFPIHDAAHVRNALARAPQSPFGDKAMPKIRAAAKKFGIHVADERSQLPAVEVEHRHSTVSDVDKRQRIVDIIAVPYDQETDVVWRGDLWHESFDRKAFDGVEAHVGRVQVNREHVKGDTVGKVIYADPSHQDGLFARVQMYTTPRGEETLTLAEQGGAFPSIGFRLHRLSDQDLDKRSKTRRIMRAYWDHQAFVEDPAYVGAGVLAVRAGQSGLVVAETPLPETPNLDEWLNDPMLAWAKKRFQ
jgi:phage head maturation protease